MENIIFVVSESGDWEVMYLEGKLRLEAHVISKTDVLDVLKGYKGDLGNGYAEYTINQEYAEENGLSIYFDKIDKSMLTKI